MSLPDSLCIDLGASFTKVAYRPAPDATTHLLTDGDLRDEHHFCIPSVAARSVERDAWVFGPDAVELRPGPRVEVFQNWKADLFASGEDGVDFSMLDDTSAEVRQLLLQRVPSLRALDIAQRYLRWLHDTQIPRMLGHERFREAEVQLCVPDFVLDSPLAHRLDRMLASIGFKNDGAYTLSEPKANLIGVLTEGRNPRTASGFPNLGAMFGDAEVPRQLAQPDQAILIVDIGAFTTDLALASFAHHAGDAFDDDPAMSTRLGVRLLDAWVLEGAPADARERVVQGSADDAHTFRVTVHGDGPRPARPEAYGLSAGQVDAAVGRFTGSILQAIDTFLAGEERAAVHAVVLTGGGANIRGVSNRLAQALAERGTTMLHAPTSTDAPGQVRKYALGPELVRGASAVGGCSILYRALG